MRVDDSQWRQVVEGLMDRASLVVLRAGDSAGFWWEFEQAARKLQAQRLLILLPYTRTEYEEFRRKAEACLQTRLPDYEVGKEQRRAPAHLGNNSLKGLIYFDANRTARFIDLGARSKVKLPWLTRVGGTVSPTRSVRYDAVESQLKLALRPVFEQLGIKWAISGLSRWSIILLVVLGVLLVVASLFIAIIISSIFY